METSKSISVLSWNIMGKTWLFLDNTFFGELSRSWVYKKVKIFLEQTKPDIICLQEASQYLPQKIDKYLQEIDYNLVNNENKKSNWNIIASKFPIVNSGEVFLENGDGINSRRIKRYPSSCLWADCKIDKSLIRIYNCQFRIRGIGIQERIYFLNSILEHAQSTPHPVIICGDMNTTIPKQGFARKIVELVHNEPDSSMQSDGKYQPQDERFIFNSVAEKFGFQEILDLTRSTWALPYTSWELFRLKLDWFFIKNIECRKYSLGKYITDHRPIFAEILLDQQ